MKLEQSDAELFYQLWFPLLDFVNRKHHVCPETETIGQRKGIDARNAKKTLGCLLLYAARFDAYEQTVKELTEVGIECEPIRVDGYTGKKMTFFHDPDGLPLELHE